VAPRGGGGSGSGVLLSTGVLQGRQRRLIVAVGDRHTVHRCLLCRIHCVHGRSGFLSTLFYLFRTAVIVICRFWVHHRTRDVSSVHNNNIAVRCAEHLRHYYTADDNAGLRNDGENRKGESFGTEKCKPHPEILSFLFYFVIFYPLIFFFCLSPSCRGFSVDSLFLPSCYKLQYRSLSIAYDTRL